MFRRISPPEASIGRRTSLRGASPVDSQRVPCDACSLLRAQPKYNSSCLLRRSEAPDRMAGGHAPPNFFALSEVVSD